MNEVIIAAIAAGLGSVITIIGKVIVDVIKAKKELIKAEKEPDQADLELKDTLQREKEKNDAAIQAFTDFGKEIKGAVEELKSEITQKIEEMDERIESYRKETREINRSEIRHSITQIYFEHCDDKTLDMRTKEDLCSLYNAYSSIGGNSFAHELYEEMMTWQVK